MSDNKQANNQNEEVLTDQEVQEAAEAAKRNGPEPGDTVMCILEANEEKIILLGKGEYRGDETVPEDVAERLGPVAAIMRMANVENPAVELERGGTVYGCECHIGPVDGYEEWKGDREEVFVDIEDVRSDDYEPITAEDEPTTEEE